MKRFLFQCLLVILFLFVLEGILYLSDVRFPTYNGTEVMQAIKNSKSESGKRLLILGDSVCNQLYPSSDKYPDAVSLACNRAVTMAGHFFLMNNYFQANESSLPERVVLVCSPSALQSDLDKFAFQYFLKPFFKKEYKPLFNDLLWKRIHQIPHFRLAAWPFIRISNYSFGYNLDSEEGYALVSPLNHSYLEAMQELAASHQVDFQLFCAPARAGKRTEILSSIDKGVENNELDGSLLSTYKNTLAFYPDSLFVDDHHFIISKIPDDPFGLLHSFPSSNPSR